MAPSKSLEWTGHHELSASPPYIPCLPIRDVLVVNNIAHIQFHFLCWIPADEIRQLRSAMATAP
jgi:hypothetical protein